MMRHGRRALLALTLFVLLAALLGLRGAVRSQSSSAAPDLADVRWQSPLGHRPPTRPEAPRLDDPVAGDAPVDQGTEARTVTLANGLVATVMPDRSRYPFGRGIDLRLEMADAAGEPLTAWDGAQLLVVGEQRSWRGGFRRDGDTPGRFYATVVPEGAGRETLEVRVLLAESGNLAEPDGWTEISYPIEYGLPARLEGFPRGLPGDDGLTVMVGVRAEAATPAGLRAQVWNDRGEVVGTAATDAALQPGANRIDLHFPGVQAPAAGGALWLGGVVLSTGDPAQWSDLADGPTFIQLPADEGS